MESYLEYECRPKLKHFWWRVCAKQPLASKENFWRRKCCSGRICPRCKVEIGSIEHIVFRCEFALKVWNYFPEVDSSLFSNVSSALVWSNEIFSNATSSSMGVNYFSRIAIVGWSSWKARNVPLFE